MSSYNWQQQDWPHFRFSVDKIEKTLLLFSQTIEHVSASLDALPKQTRQDVIADILLAEAMKSTENNSAPARENISSSIRQNLNLTDTAKLVNNDSGKLMVDVYRNFNEPLTMEKILEWQGLLAGEKNNITDTWRTVEIIYEVANDKRNILVYQPPSNVTKEMKTFIAWFNNTAPGGKQEILQAPVRAAIAYLYFVTIQPLSGISNEKIAKFLAEKALSQTMGKPVPLSLSRTLNSKDFEQYYNELNKALRSNEISSWIAYFADGVLDAQRETEKQIKFIIKKNKFLQKYKERLNDRQLLVITDMLRDGPDESNGIMFAGKYMLIADVSKATATRDMQQLFEIGAFIPERPVGGRSTTYRVNL